MAAEDFLVILLSMLGTFQGASLSAHPLPRKSRNNHLDAWFVRVDAELILTSFFCFLLMLGCYVY